MLKEKADFLRIIGDETKLRIIQYLMKGELCACGFIKETKRAQSTVSKHLNDLERAGILKSRRDGRNIYYSIKDKRIYKIFRILEINEKEPKNRKC